MASAWALSQRRIVSRNGRGVLIEPERGWRGRAYSAARARCPARFDEVKGREKNTPWSNRKTALFRFLKAVSA